MVTQTTAMAVEQITDSSVTPMLAAGDSDNSYRSLLYALPDAFVAIDTAGRVVEWSPRAQEMFGWSASEICGRSAAELALPTGYMRNMHANLPVFIRRIGRGDAWGLSAHLAIDSAGKEFPVELSAARAPQALSQKSQHVLLIKDISQRLVAEERFAQAAKMEAIGQLVSGLAHDFNNALGIIQGCLETLAIRIKEPINRELIDLAIAATERGTETTRSMQAVARRQAVQHEPIDLNKALLNLRPLLEKAAGNEIELVLLPEAANSNVVLDVGALNNALLNLLINARDAMSSGGVVLIYTQNFAIEDDPLDSVDLTPGHYVVLGVDDTGSGMPADIVSRAMEPFFTTKPKGRGTGLGLAMVYAFARQSAGTLRIRSTPGKGTNIHLFFPVKAFTGNLQEEDRHV